MMLIGSSGLDGDMHRAEAVPAVEKTQGNMELTLHPTTFVETIAITTLPFE